MNLLYAAGVLFIGNSIDGTTYFLLGKDHENKWSNFGGSCEKKDKSDQTITAAREAWEETLGCVDEYESIKNMIKFKSDKCFNLKTPSGYPYYLYTVRIPFNNLYRDKFISTKKFISSIPEVDKKFLEIHDVKWVSYETLKHSVNNKRAIIRLRSSFENSLNSILGDLKDLN